MTSHYLLNSILIAPPSGQFFTSPALSPLPGSYPLQSLTDRDRQALKTIRPLGYGYWVNRSGLRNPSIDNLPLLPHLFTIASSVAITDTDWQQSNQSLSHHPHLKDNQVLEINLSCSNIDQTHFDYQQLAELKNILPHLIIKLPPLAISAAMIKHFMPYGIKTFHLSNTFQTRQGGLSGKLLHRINHRLISRLRRKFGNDIQIIAGGSSQRIDDVVVYLNLHVNAVSLGTRCYSPWKFPHLIKQIHQYLPEKIELEE